MRRLRVIVAVAAALGAVSACYAATSVSPTLIDVRTNGAAASALKIHNSETTPMRVQVRVFRWSQAEGADQLTPTSEVGASPPFATVPAGADYTIRVVRFATTKVSGEESYRLLIDELPGHKDLGVVLAIRHSVPVFFQAAGASPADLHWRAQRHGGNLIVTVANSGQVRARVANLRLVDLSGTDVTVGNGLAGYALGSSGRGWVIKDNPKLDLFSTRVVFDGEKGSRTTSLEPAPSPVG